METYLIVAAAGIGCAGEVKITPDDDYAKWAIDILVKFRDDEKLQLLTAQRQSGGVRSFLFDNVATANSTNCDFFRNAP